MDRRFALASVLFGLATAFSLTGRRLEAATVDKRLLKLTKREPITREEAVQVADALETATEDALALPTKTQIQVRDAVKTTALGNASPPFTTAAGALVDYARSTPVPPSQAETAMISAAREALRAVRPESRWPAFTVDRPTAESAISALTRVVALSSTNRRILADALLTRADLYEFLQEHDQALRDIDAAEKAGAADLSDIIATEGLALVNRGIAHSDPADMERAVKLLTLKAQLPPPSLIANSPQQVLLDEIDTFSLLATAHYALGQYDAAIQDSRRLLELFQKQNWANEEFHQTGLRIGYLTIIAADLRMGDAEDALKAASELEHVSNGHPDVVAIRKALGRHPLDPQPILDEIDSFLKVKPLRG